MGIVFDLVRDVHSAIDRGELGAADAALGARGVRRPAIQGARPSMALRRAEDDQAARAGRRDRAVDGHSAARARAARKLQPRRTKIRKDLEETGP